MYYKILLILPLEAPQDTVRGPLFIIIFINKILRAIILCSRATWVKTQIETQNKIDIVGDYILL